MRDQLVAGLVGMSVVAFQQPRGGVLPGRTVERVVGVDTHRLVLHGDTAGSAGEVGDYPDHDRIDRCGDGGVSNDVVVVVRD